MTDDEAKRCIGARVSRETFARLETYETLLRKWQASINLVAKGTLTNVWARHFLDSVQLLEHAPSAVDLWLDLGSGGGFPGMACAICADDYGVRARFELVESDTRKCAFIREVARQTGIDADVRNARVEALEPASAEVLTARALAPLPTLLGWAHRHLRPGGICLLQKGSSYGLELETARSDWQMDVDVLTSVTAPDSVILRIRNLCHA